jgi:MoxR-like ATPase
MRPRPHAWVARREDDPFMTDASKTGVQQSEPRDDARMVESLGASYRQITEELARVIVGMDDVIEQVMVAMFCRGHCILEGVPGLAKTLLISTIAGVLHLSFKRIQFTPDLMPADITGTDVLEEDRTTGKRIFRFMPGPVFANMILADEINRTPPKTQAALLEAMQEHQVTVGESTFRLAEPFFVLATQNPIEQEGTYPLPEAQLDRFMFKVRVGYPTAADELSIMKRGTSHYASEVSPVLTGEQILRLQDIVRRVPVADHVYDYARSLTRATRPKTAEAPTFIDDWVAWGAGPRASIYLILGGKARAILHGRFHVTTEDVRAMALPVLRHRIITTFNAEAAGKTPDDVIEQLLGEVPVTSEKRLATA